MTSILTNGAAISALQTLRSISSSLDVTQRMVASGMRVQTASDSAAYWSISMTMKSDRMAMSAVSDALGLGAAKIDTAYAGMNAVVDVLSEFKAKLVAATEDGVDKTKIQTELEQLKQQIVGIADGASFSGENLLKSADTASHNSLASSFAREPDGTIGISRLEVPKSRTTLFAVDGSGLLDAGVAPDPGQLGSLDIIASGPNYAVRHTFSGPLAFVDDSTYITFDLTINADNPAYVANPHPGTVHRITINRSVVDAALPAANGTVSTKEEMVAVLSEAFTGIDAYAYLPISTGNYAIYGSTVQGVPRASTQISNVVSTLSGGATGGLRNNSAFGEAPEGVIDQFDEWSTGKSEAQMFPIRIDKGEVNLRLTFARGFFFFEPDSEHIVTIDRETIRRALGNNDGIISSFSDMSKVFNTAFADAGHQIDTDVRQWTYGVAAGKLYIYMDADERQYTDVGSEALMLLEFQDARPKPGILDIDITDGSRPISSSLFYVEKMLNSVIDGASYLGALQTRVEMQIEFAAKMMSSVDRGVGRLVDADMNEASTRLKAIQTQQQLAIQSLSIANTSAEQVMQLFR